MSCHYWNELKSCEFATVASKRTIQAFLPLESPTGALCSVESRRPEASGTDRETTSHMPSATKGCSPSVRVPSQPQIIKYVIAPLLHLDDSDLTDLLKSSVFGSSLHWLNSPRAQSAACYPRIPSCVNGAVISTPDCPRSVMGAGPRPSAGPDPKRPISSSSGAARVIGPINLTMLVGFLGISE